MKKLINTVWPRNKKIGFLAMIFSVLSVVCTGIIRMYFLYKKLPEYPELVAGYTSWNAYFKKGDMTLAYHVIFGGLFFFFLWSWILCFFSKIIPFLQRDFAEKFVTEQNRTRIREGNLLCCFAIFTQFTFSILERGLTCLFPATYALLDTLFYPLHFIWLILSLFLWLFLKKRGNQKGLENCLYFSQLLLPFVFLEITRFEYEYKGQIFLQYFSWKFLIFEVIITFLLMGYLLYKRKKSKEVQLYVTSFLSLAVFASYVLPRGTISGSPVEFYHYGELSVPLHQFLQFGTVPYLDTMPIHGICDYFQAGVWHLFFDGTYASFEAAMVIGCVIIAVITGAVYYYFVDNKAWGLLCILFFSLFGDLYYYVRWAFVLPSIFIVFSRKSKEKFGIMLWSWTFLSVLSIAWNPSIGGTCALAMLPMILHEFFFEKGYLEIVKIWKNRKEHTYLFIGYICLLILGLCFIPMFFEIVRYITENSAAILETTGDILKEELADPYVWYATFGFLFPILISLYFCIGKKGDDKKWALFGALFLWIFNGIIVKYTFVRTQFGERGIIATTISCLFLLLMILLPYGKKYWDKGTIAWMLLLFFMTTATKGENLFTMPYKLLERESISENFEFVKGEEIGIPALGHIFMDEKLREELCDFNHVANELCGETYQFVDMTNQLSHYNILNKKVLLPFSSTYNTNNEVMQKKAIEILCDLQPEVVVVSPAWNHDAGALSIRNYHLYQWFMQHGYIPCKYNSVLFLTNQQEIAQSYDMAYEEFGKCMHIEDLKRLPVVWASEKIKEHNMRDLPVNLQLIDTNSQILEEQVYDFQGEDIYFFYTFENPVSGKEIDFLRIQTDILEGPDNLSYQGVVYFMGEDVEIKEASRFIYNGGANEIVIPLSTSPYWSYTENNYTILVNFLGYELVGTKMHLELSLEEYIGPGRYME
ncbi:MAG: hypothetical protein HFI33_09680 [Lachnospiraceae bacterium]|nr:hypothetical protein [Lachnospiraceae bacterium]